VNMKMEREEAAADAFERVLKIDPQNGSAKNNLGIVQEILKRKQI
jgi:Tfp pilus assembly protein PilF